LDERTQHARQEGGGLLVHKGTSTLPSFQLEKKKGGKWRDEGKLPTDYKYKRRVQRKQTLQEGYEEVTIKFLFTF